MSKFKTWVKLNSPEILLASAIVNSALSVVTGCIATAKIGKRILEPAKPKALELHNAVEALEKDPNATKEVISKAKKERNVYYLKVGGKILLYYLPTVASFGLSTASMIGSHNIMRGRNIALASAFSALKLSYDTLNDKIKEKFGDDVAKELTLDSNKKTVVVKDSKGKDTTKEIDTPKENNANLFVELWGPGCLAYDITLDRRANINYLYEVQRVFNDKLKADGVVFLSDVYEQLGYTPAMLGKDKILASRVTGWKYDKEDKNCDAIIDLGLLDENGNESRNVKDFLVGKIEYLTINFNVDGDITTDDKQMDKVAKLLIERSK